MDLIHRKLVKFKLQETPLLENPAQPPNPHPTTHSPNQVKFELSWGVDPGGGDQSAVADSLPNDNVANFETNSMQVKR